MNGLNEIKRANMLKSFRYLLYPFSVLYGGVIWVRNKLFDKNILRSSTFNFPLICVGNLAVGGTGKTPMVEYLINILKPAYNVATLSRGYKRKTKGFAIANEDTSALEIGDEPMQIHIKFPKIIVAVAEERVIGIPQLLHDRPETEVILLDDAFQHREVQAGINILLTDYNNLYTRDLLLPAGDLRDIKGSSKRADIIVVTKSKSMLTEQEAEKIREEISPEKNQQVLFTKIHYAAPYHLFNREEKIPSRDCEVLLVCGIANPGPLKEAVSAIVDYYEAITFRDHHIFTTSDLREIRNRFAKIDGDKKIILTTEKDAVRLLKYKNEIEDWPLYVLPMEHQFLFGEEVAFERSIVSFVEGFSKKS